MPGPTTLREALPDDADAAAVNGYLRALVADTEGLYHVWIAGDDRFELRGRLPRRKSVAPAALEAWKRIAWCVERLSHDLRRWQHDEESVRLLHRLAVHPAPVVYLPAALALATLSRVPPLAALEELRARGRACPPPAWWQRPAVAYRALRWEVLCVRLADHLYDEVLAGLRNETRCADGLIPDIATGTVERDGRGLIVRADTIIDAKSGSLPHAHSYADRCSRLEYWHAATHGAWVRRGGPAACEIIYRDVRELVAMAEGADGLAADMEEFATGESYARLYLRFLEERALTAMDACELAPTLEAPRR